MGISKDFSLILSVALWYTLGNTVETVAQSKVGTTIGQFLKIEPSARATALGNASASLSGEAVATFYNPASLGRLSRSNVQFSHSEWLADINHNYVAAAIRITDLGTFFLQVTSFNSGEIEVRTVQQPLGTGERYDVSNFAMGVGYGRMLTDRVSVGMQVHYWQEAIWNSTVSGVGFNFGVQYQLAANGPTLGASVSNFGPRARFDGRDLFIEYDFDPDIFGDNDKLPAELRTDSYLLPTLFRVGISWPLQLRENSRVLFAVDGTNPNDNDQSVSMGAEWQISKHFFLRGGYRDLFLPDSEGGLTLGGGIDLNYSSNYGLSFDYAWADYGRLNDIHRFTLGLEF